MIEIGFNKVYKNFGSQVVLNDLNFEIKTNEKVGIIGDNGCGKSTILKLIYKEENISSGNIFIRNGVRIGYLSQDGDSNFENILVKEILYSSFEDVNLISNKLNDLEFKMSNSNDNLEKLVNRYCQLQEEFISIGGYEVKSKIEKLVSAFKIEKLLDLSFESLSGGEKTIINLIYLLLKDVDVLLLDEPTNHLDIDTVTWLEEYLNSCKKTVVIVSHDRYFLDKVVNKIIYIDRGKADIYFGNYSYYLVEKENRLMKEFNDYKNQQRQIEAMKKSIKKLYEFGKLAYPGGEPFFRRAQSIQKRLDKLEVLDKPKNDDKINLAFSFSTRGGNRVLTLDKISLQYDNNILLKNASMEVFYGNRVALIGKNGCGKSSLIKYIISNFNDDKIIGSNIKIGYLAQSSFFEDENITILDEVRKYFIGSIDILRSALTKFLFFEEDVNKKIKNLSGGEKIRLKLFCLMQEDNNFLIFDEPTNHIDIATREVLEDALLEYKGTILFVSHDRYFINKLATSVVSFDNNKLNSYIGNYDDFIRSTR